MNVMWHSIRGWFRAVRRTWGLVRAYWPPFSEDWSGLASIMLYEMDQMAKGLRRNQIVEDCDKYADQIDATATALRHLLESDAFDYADRDCPGRGEQWASRVDYWNDRWLNEFVGGMRYIQHWWD